MEELIARIVEKVGVDESVAQKAVEIILGFLKDAGPADQVSELLGQLPGADAAADAGSGAAGMLGAMGAFNALTGAGLGMGDVQSVTKEVVGFAREKAGADKVDEVISSIPGLSQFI